MQAIFLGNQILDFQPKDGSYIKGLKVFFAFPPENRNWQGLEVHSSFLDYENDRICYDCVLKLESLQPYEFDFATSFTGKPKLKFVYPVEEKK